MSFYLDFPLDAPDCSYKVALEGILYNFRFRWNTLSEAWHCYVGQAGEDYALQIKVRTGKDIFADYAATAGVPPGLLLLVDLQKDYGRPSIDNIGTGKRFQFVYIETTEL